MSEIKSESISSLVDNYSPSTDDCVSEHLIESMLKDENLSSTWQNYHLIGDVLRDEVPQALQLDLSAAISEAIAQEATILSPKSSAQRAESDTNTGDSIHNEESAQSVSRVVDATNRFKAKVYTLVKPMGQVAIAASAAALMIVGVQSNVADYSLPVTPNQVVQTRPLAGYANPVSYSVQAAKEGNSHHNKHYAPQVTNEQLAAELLAQQRRLHALLKDHQQQVQLGNKIK
jgi:sigma-E factor negative regulatory protein RseA